MVVEEGGGEEVQEPAASGGAELLDLDMMSSKPSQVRRGCGEGVESNEEGCGVKPSPVRRVKPSQVRRGCGKGL